MDSRGIHRHGSIQYENFLPHGCEVKKDAMLIQVLFCHLTPIKKARQNCGLIVVLQRGTGYHHAY